MALAHSSATASATKPHATKEPRARRSPISRAEGERRMIDAAKELLRDRPFSSVGVRDIASRSDVNQGFIHSWFGSQNGLYVRVVQDLFASMLSRIEQQPAESVALDPLDADVRFATRLLFWLDLEGVDTDPVRAEFDLLMHAFSHRLIAQVGLTAATAAAITMQASAIGLGIAAFGHLFGADDTATFAGAVEVWRHQLGLLAANPPHQV